MWQIHCLHSSLSSPDSAVKILMPQFFSTTYSTYEDGILQAGNF